MQRPHKEEFPPLLPQGFHSLTLLQLRKLCVDDFPESGERVQIFAGVQAVFERAWAVGIRCDVWLDGSFVTKKIDPGDVDFILLIDSVYYDHGTAKQAEFIDWLINNERDPKTSFRCDTDAVLMYPPSSPLHNSLTRDTLKHWEEKVYGFSVATREPKGIVVLQIPEPTPEPEPETDVEELGPAQEGSSI